MATPQIAAGRVRRRAAPRPRWGAGAGPVGLGVVTLWLSLIVLLPLAAVVAKAYEDGWGTFWEAISAKQAVDALVFTVLISLAAAALNAVTGTLVAWVLVRDDFRGKAVVNALIDLPFALPTIVAGLTLIALYGHGSPVGVDVAYTRWAVLLALLFVTQPFVVRSVQPVLLELDRDMEQAAASLGATPAQVFRRIVLPNLRPAIVSGAALSFARAVGEFGSIVLISGNVPFHTEVSSVYIFKLQESSESAVPAAAVSAELLFVSLLVLLALRVSERRSLRDDR
jgi:sulfate transport system permease protein